MVLSKIWIYNQKPSVPRGADQRCKSATGTWRTARLPRSRKDYENRLTANSGGARSFTADRHREHHTRIISQTTLQTLQRITLSNQAAGRITANWDGRGDSGTSLPPGRYTIAISADSMGSSAATLHAVTKISY